MIQPRKSGLLGRVVERVYLGELAAIRVRLAGGHELWCRRLSGEVPEGDAAEIGWDTTAVSILPEATQ
jgi:hypothetical protein